MKVFISHAQADKDLASRMATALRREGLDVWLADREILPGDNWAEKVGQGLRESGAMVVLLTESALESNHVRSEIEFALGNKDYSWRLIPVVIGHPTEGKLRNLPWIIKRLPMIKMESPDQLAATARQVSESLLAAA